MNATQKNCDAYTAHLLQTERVSPKERELLLRELREELRIGRWQGLFLFVGLMACLMLGDNLTAHNLVLLLLLTTWLPSVIVLLVDIVRARLRKSASKTNETSQTPKQDKIGGCLI